MIRNAEIKDIPEMIFLVNLVLKDMELPLFDILTEKQITDLLEQACLDKDYRYNPDRAVVFECDGKVAGLAVGYPDTVEPIIDNPFQKLLHEQFSDVKEKLFSEVETLPNEWYLDTLVVAEDYRGRGIAKKLLNYLPTVAKEAGNDKIGLNVDLDNPKAKKLYESVGFKKVGQQMIGSHQYDHMQYTINYSKS